jgi:uncharacterized protein (TIGR02722 family)
MKGRKSLFALATIFFLAAVVASCATKVTRIGVEEVVDLSGMWNDTDSRLVSEEMISDALNRNWLPEFKAKTGKKPRVIVGKVLNRSHEHINTQTFVKDLERELTNSGKVRFVASSEQRGEIRAEREDQAKHAAMETIKGPGQEYGADFMIKGQINTIWDEAGKTKLKYYQVELEMIDIATNEKVWIGQKKIKKVVTRPRAKF